MALVNVGQCAKTPLSIGPEDGEGEEVSETVSCLRST